MIKYCCDEILGTERSVELKGGERSLLFLIAIVFF
ncbi:MAG: hypothetical protein RLZZ115_3528 [Cyanobacteriota bacterium]